MAEQHCPICHRTVLPSPLYPRYACGDCSAKAVSADGRALRFDTVDISGGFAASYVDTGEEYLGHECFIEGVTCYAAEARFGGIVIQVTGP